MEGKCDEAAALWLGPHSARAGELQNSLFVHLQGVVRASNGTVASTTGALPILTLPHSMRPSITHRFVTTTAPDDIHSEYRTRRLLVQVDFDGLVSVRSLVGSGRRGCSCCGCS